MVLNGINRGENLLYPPGIGSPFKALLKYFDGTIFIDKIFKT